ncbi:HIT family protein [Candidatus Woesearchaeota archaeon]|nr:HIT family protein [Candidatus Woesearchaeota archaeon]
MYSEIILEDEELFVIQPQNAITKGHTIIVPKEKYTILEEVPKDLIKKMLQTANKISSILFETMQCHGTNILIQNGTAAGQQNPQFSINILPRYENDDINFEWTPKQATQQELAESEQLFKNREDEENKKKYLEEQKNKTQPKKEEEIKEDDEKENYLTKSLSRTA